MATHSEVLRTLTILKQTYPGYAVKPETVAIYAALLSDISAEDLRKAAEEHMRTSRWFPAVSDLRGLCESGSDDHPHPEEAWLEVKGTVRRVGFYGVPQFTTDQIAKAVASIGWEALCSAQINEMSILRAQFLRAYAAFRDRALRSEREAIENPKVASLVAGIARSFMSGHKKESP